MKDKINSFFWLCLHPRITVMPYQHLFILSHMRSRSTLLAHILGSHAQIVGHTETYRSYKHIPDLWKLRVQLHRTLTIPSQTLYLLDKLNLNHLIISPNILEKAKVIFLLREPIATVKSLIKLGCDYQEMKEVASPEKAIQAYVDRLQELERYAYLVGDQGFFIESDQLITQSDEMFPILSRWLGVSELLKGSYTIFNETGKIGHGDPSMMIRTGHIFRTPVHDDVIIPYHYYQKLEYHYHHCKNILSKRCQTIVS